MDLIDLQDNAGLRSLFVHFRALEASEDARDKSLRVLAAILDTCKGGSLENIEFRIPVDWCVELSTDDETDDGSEEGLSVDDESVEWAAPLGEVLARDNFRPLKRVVIGVYAPPTDEVGAKYDIAAVAEDLKTYFQVWDDRGIFFVELSQDILCLEALTCMTNAF